MVSDNLIQARVKATEALKSAFTWKAKHEANYQTKVARAKKRGQLVPKFKPMKCPQSVLCPVRSNVKTFSLNWQNQDIRLSTSRGKISISFTVPEFSCKYQGYPVATADLLCRQQNKNVQNKRKLHSWTFAQLYDFTTYKAQERGMQVVKIDPRHTSQTCSHCGSQHRS